MVVAVAVELELTEFTTKTTIKFYNSLKTCHDFESTKKKL